MMAGGDTACQPAHKTLAGWRLRERDGKLRFAPPVLSLL